MVMGKEALPQWCEVAIKKEGLDLPIKHREYLSEVFMDTGPWKKHPRRMLEHKTMIQAIRYAFGVSGIPVRMLCGRWMSHSPYRQIPYRQMNRRFEERKLLFTCSEQRIARTPDNTSRRSL